MIKIFFSDVDGTLLNKQSMLTKKTIDACIKVQVLNIPFVLNSGRYTSNLKNLAHIISVDKYQGYTIGNDGSEIWSFKENKFLYLQQLTNEMTINLGNWLLNYEPNMILIFCSINNVYVNKIIPEQFKNLVDQLKLNVININNYEEIKELVSKIIVVLLPQGKSKLQNFSQSFAKEFNDLTISNYGPNIYSIGRKNVNKGTAIKWLCEYLKIKCEDACAFGDNVNDISMFNTVGHKMIMANATDDIKKLGTTILANDQEGVACFLEEYFQQIKNN